MIDPNAVTALFESVLDPNGKVIEGVSGKYAISVTKLEKDRALVKSWIVELPTEFLTEGGGGWTWLNLCQTQGGDDIWTGMQLVGDQLLVLAMALGLGAILMPREMWSLFPGGVPYVSLTLKDPE